MNSLYLRFPATSANLGPGFDALALAMALYLDIEASEADDFQLHAIGRAAAQISHLEQNLILETYRAVAPAAPPLRLTLSNQIPLGMGCGSSAAALLAGVTLANHFGHLKMTPEQVRNEACRREGHPDNVAACFHGGFTTSLMDERGEISAVSFDNDLRWRLLLVLPAEGLATSKARALLPKSYSQADTVANIQATALLVAAFAQNRPDLLLAATRDRVHQPYRSMACPLLPKLSPLAGNLGIYSVTLSGAGPSVLLMTDESKPIRAVQDAIFQAVGVSTIEILETHIASVFEINAMRLPKICEGT